MASNNNPVFKHRKAHFEFELHDRYVAGMVLTGTEIKAIREGRANLKDSFCYFHKGELYVKNMHISEYTHGNIENHEPKRDRKLLMKKSELNKLHDKVKAKGFTIVPTKLFIGKSGYAKLEVALARGKQVHDKRRALKEKELKKDIKDAGF